MSAANRRRGADAERAVVAYLRANGSRAFATSEGTMDPYNASEPGAVGAAPARGQHLVGGAVMAQRTPFTRFWAKVDKSHPSGCWLWTGATNGRGYGRFWLEGAKRYAHRVSYEWAHGSIPDGLQLDHLCRTTLCVNPAHLEPVTNRENTVRGRVSEINRRRGAAIGSCPQGHPYDEANTRWKNGHRHCRACARQRANGTTDAYLCRSCGKRHYGSNYPVGELAEPEDGVRHRLHDGVRLCSLPYRRSA